jgi:hypothetical protein
MYQEGLYRNFVLVALLHGNKFGAHLAGILFSSRPVIWDLTVHDGVPCAVACYRLTPDGLKTVAAVVTRLENMREGHPSYADIGIGITHGSLPVSPDLSDSTAALKPVIVGTDLAKQALKNAQGPQTYRATLDEMIDFMG